MYRMGTYVGCGPVIPKHHSVRAPLYASLIIATLVDMVVQESEDGLC